MSSLSIHGRVVRALTIAGSDSSAGAGIQADLKTFASLSVYGTCAVTAVTAQNTQGVLAIAEVPEEVIASQIDALMDDIGADAVKTGMLSSASIVEVVADRLEAWGLTRLVVDPVMVAKSGDVLLAPDAIDVMTTKLLPLAMVVTPNIPEAEVLSGVTIRSEETLREAARVIHASGPAWVVVKGGHLAAAPDDLVFDGSTFTVLPGQRIATSNTHGTGCTFSAAITAYLARGYEPLPAIAAAKDYITAALAASYPIGRGHSPVNHFHNIRSIAAG